MEMKSVLELKTKTGVALRDLFPLNDMLERQDELRQLLARPEGYILTARDEDTLRMYRNLHHSAGSLARGEGHALRVNGRRLQFVLSAIADEDVTVDETTLNNLDLR